MACVEHIDTDEQGYFSEALITYDDIEAHDADVDRRELDEARNNAAA